MDADRFLMGAPKVPSARFDFPGTTVSGQVIFMETRQQTIFGTNEVATWPSGDPKYQLVVHIQTPLREPHIENDNGQRALYIKGKQFEGAVRDAVRAAGQPGIREGGFIQVTFTGLDMSSIAPQKPKKYAVVYQGPAMMPPAAPQPGYGAPAQVGQHQVASGYQAPPQQLRQTAPPVYTQHQPNSWADQGPPPEWATAAPVSAPVQPAQPPMSTLARLQAMQGQAPVSGQPNVGPEPAF